MRCRWSGVVAVPSVADGVGHAGLVQAHDVHVALDHHQSLQAACRLPRLEQAVKLAALVEQLRLGRVQVLRLALVEHAAAEADGPSARVADREHHAVAEAVVVAGFRAGPGVVAVALDDQACAQQDLALVVGGAVAAEQGVPPGGRVADAEALRWSPRSRPRRLQIVLRARLAAQRLPEEQGCAFHRDVQLVMRVRRRRGAAFARHLQAGARSEFLDRLDEAEVVVVHDEAERRAVRAAAEAVIELLVRAHRERRRSSRRGTGSRPCIPCRPCFNCTRLPITSTMSVRAISSSMKCCGMRPATLLDFRDAGLRIVGAPKAPGKPGPGPGRRRLAGANRSDR